MKNLFCYWCTSFISFSRRWYPSIVRIPGLVGSHPYCKTPGLLPYSQSSSSYDILHMHVVIGGFSSAPNNMLNSKYINGHIWPLRGIENLIHQYEDLVKNINKLDTKWFTNMNTNQNNLLAVDICSVPSELCQKELCEMSKWMLVWRWPCRENYKKLFCADQSWLKSLHSWKELHTELRYIFPS
jgi:hypothetical protein